MLSLPFLQRKNSRLCYLLCSRYEVKHVGFILEILSFGAILSVATGNPAKFAIVYSIGNILTLAA